MKNTKKKLLVLMLAVSLVFVFGACYKSSFAASTRGTNGNWVCWDVTSFDGNGDNDNECFNRSTGEVRYVSDSAAEALDPSYRAKKIGPRYYNY